MISLGTIVEVIDEKLKGKVVRMQGENCILVTDEGFEISFPKSQLVAVRTDEISVNYHESLQAIHQKDAVQKKKNQFPKTKDKNIVRLEIDLHIEQLTTKPHQLSSYDKLTLQVDTARYHLEFAIEKGIQRIVFIHGVGEGVLRTELEYLFGRYAQVSFQDADYTRYGLGATEIYIHQNKR